MTRTKYDLFFQRSQSHSRRLTSAGHSDSSGRSSPTEQQQNQSSWTRALNHEGFRVGDPVRKDSDKYKNGNNKDTSSMPHFSTGKDYWEFELLVIFLFFFAAKSTIVYSGLTKTREFSGW